MIQIFTSSITMCGNSSFLAGVPPTSKIEKVFSTNEEYSRHSVNYLN